MTRDVISDRKFGRILYIKEITGMKNETIRVFGKLIYYDLSSQLAVLEHQGARICLNTSLLGNFSHVIGRFYQVIGELQEYPKENNGFIKELNMDINTILQCRIIRNIDGMDLNMFHKALHARRQFLKDCA